jgi:hypothetical protein
VAVRLRLAVTADRDTAARFRLLIAGAAFRDTGARVRLQVGPLYRDTAARVRLAATAWRDVQARVRLRVTAYRDTATRFKLQIAGQAWRDAAARVRLRVGPLWRDTTGRFRLQVPAYRDTATRLRLAMAGSRDVGTRFRLVLARAYRDVATRARVRVGGSHDAGTRFALITFQSAPPRATLALPPRTFTFQVPVTRTFTYQVQQARSFTFALPATGGTSMIASPIGGAAWITPNELQAFELDFATSQGFGTTEVLTGFAVLPGGVPNPTIWSVNPSAVQAGIIQSAALTSPIVSLAIAPGGGGTGYPATGTISFSGSGVDGAGTYTSSGGVIQSVQLTNPGKGYATVPTPVLSGSGTGAVLTVTLQLRRVTLWLANCIGGQSYIVRAACTTNYGRTVELETTPIPCDRMP